MGMTGSYVGVDVSKGSLDIAARPRQPAQSFRNDQAGINDAVDYVKGLEPVWW
jgi:transposase